MNINVVKEYINKIVVYSKTHKVISIIGAVILIGALYFGYKTVFGKTTTTRYILGTVVRGDLKKTVTGTGQVSSSNQVDLKPQGSSQSTATIGHVYVKQGDTVYAGQLIATINNPGALISLHQAQANVAGQQASYDKLLAGATSQNLAVSQASLDSAKVSLENAHRSLLSSNLIAVPTITDATTVTAPTISGTYLSDEEGVYTLTVHTTGDGHGYFDLAGLESGVGTVSVASPSPLGTRGLYIQFPVGFGTSVNQTWTISIPNKQSSSYTQSYNSYQSAKASYEQSQASFAVTAAPPRQEDIDAAKASLANAQASLESAQNNYDQNFLRAPFNGIVAQVNVSPGDQASTSTVVASVITNEQLAEISLNEVDAAQVKVGEPVDVTFSAIPGLSVTGKVYQVDTIGTVTQGVVSYSAKISFNTEDSRIKPGMSVSASITTATDTGVLLAPNSAINTIGSKSYVKVPVDAPVGAPTDATTATAGGTVRRTGSGGGVATTTKSVEVTIGDSDNTQSVILSGLTEGQKIVVRSASGGTQTTASKPTASLLGSPRGL